MTYEQRATVANMMTNCDKLAADLKSRGALVITPRIIVASALVAAVVSFVATALVMM